MVVIFLFGLGSGYYMAHNKNQPLDASDFINVNAEVDDEVELNCTTKKHEAIINSQQENPREWLLSHSNVDDAKDINTDNLYQEQETTHETHTQYIEENPLSAEFIEHELDISNKNKTISITSEYEFELIDHLVDDILQKDEDALNDDSIGKFLLSIIQARELSTLTRFSALNQLNGLIQPSHIELIERLFYQEVFDNIELAWQAVNLVNLSVIDEPSVDLLNTLSQDTTLPYEFKKVITDILNSHNNGEVFDMRPVMVFVSQDLTRLLLE